MSASRICVVGGGAWGTALALAMVRAGQTVSLWTRDEEAARSIRAGCNPAYLPGLTFETDIAASSDLATALDGADCVLLATPAQVMRQVLGVARSLIEPGTTLVICAKGIESATGKLLSAVAGDIAPASRIATLSGPSFATDVAGGLPTAVVVAAGDESRASDLAMRFSSLQFRCYSTDDQIGVEIGGALKNIFAIAAGATLGAGLGASAQAALVTRGFVELRRIGAAYGARPETLMGLSGLGDLMLTSASPQSRNFGYGLALGRGEDLSGRPLAEGVATAGVAARIAAERNLAAPILTAVAQILDGRLTIRDAVASLMSRPLRSESE